MVMILFPLVNSVVESLAFLSGLNVLQLTKLQENPITTCLSMYS